MIKGLGPYPAMTDTGVPWLGAAPAHWERRRLKTLLAIIDRRSSTGTETLLSLRRDHGIVVYSEHFSRPAQGATLVGYKIVKKGQLVVNRLQANNGLVFDSSLDGLVSPDYSVFEHRRSDQIVMPYLSLLLRTPMYRNHFRRESTGLGTGSAGFLRLYDDRLLETPVVLPPTEEQASILRFLDHADRRIRRYIRARQKLIKLLEEQKLAIIDGAVTRGLDPNMRLRSSGLEWLGEVPEAWEIVRLKTLVSQVTSGSRGWSNFAADTGPLFIRIGNLTRSSVDLAFEDVIRLRLPAEALAEAERTRVQPNDILLSITAYIGSVAVVPSDIKEAYVSQHVACCRPRPGAVNPRWVGYALLSSVGQAHGQLSMYGGTKQGLSLDDVKNYVVPLPPLDDQARLVTKIEDTSSSVDRSIRNVRREIELLREYRTRLITDVVTGKLDLREAAAQLPDDIEEADEGGDIDTEANIEDSSDAVDAVAAGAET